MSKQEEQKSLENNEVVKSDLAKKEEEILAFWTKNNIFKKTIEKKAKGDYIFYDGPPFATGLPHYGHLLAGTMKDTIPRYQTMKGMRVKRRWGWDCHGLPIENMIEKELGLNTKKDIEVYGIDKFNSQAMASVMRYDKEWRKIVPRTGRFVDMENEYKTMDSSYTESVWWAFKNLHDKGLIFEGFKSMHLCPRCGTTLSNFEVNQGYKDITDISVTVKMELVDSAKTFLLAWTTTPWTLPGNVALAINPEMNYVEFSLPTVSDEKYIIAESRLSNIKDAKIVRSFSGNDLIGKSYISVFDYYSKSEIKNKENGWKIYGADFVTAEDGTGVVHIAPAFGEDDMNLGKKYNLPFVQHVGIDGKFKKEVVDFAGQDVKPKDTKDGDNGHQKADIEIIKYLAHNGRLFAKEKLVHSYPHCWRCSTPLLNYASNSWFLNVPKIKNDLIKANKKVNWIPQDIKDGRFGKWLEGARDWAISRSRYWGAPIPVWKCNSCAESVVFGSAEDIKKNVKSTNKYFVMRHGQAENNVKHILSSVPENKHSLTDEGKKQIEKTLKKLKKEKIDIIISSDFLRTKETAMILRDSLGLKGSALVFDKRLREFDFGDFNLKTEQDYFTFLPDFFGNMEKQMPNGETLMDVRRRVGDFMYEMEKKYSGKNILLVSHETPIWLLSAVTLGLNDKKTVEIRDGRQIEFIKNGEYRLLDFSPVPHNKDYEIDFHRPHIDTVTFPCKCGGKMKRIEDVFDCWFESGSVPFAESHYPFENLKIFNPKKNIGFPADFIAEGLDQTRGWFYTTLVLGVALFGKSPYKNVIVNGIVLAEDGQKMSKSLRNYPDPWNIINKYGADALRYYLLSSPVIRAEDINFAEKSVDEVVKKVIQRLNNVYSFYEMYAPTEITDFGLPHKLSLLDSWIIARLNELLRDVTIGLDNFELDKASRPISLFVDDLSTWYLRRSRDRFKSENLAEKNEVISVLSYVFIEFAKIIAPFMPFLAEDLYQKVSKGGLVESVHLENWPKIKKPNTKLINEMEEVRRLVSQGLELRSKSGIKVRQPLPKVILKSEQLRDNIELCSLIEDELNIKEVGFDDRQIEDIILDTTITPELKDEGDMRDFVRALQELRKSLGMTPNTKVDLKIMTDIAGKDFVTRHMDTIKLVVGVKNISFVESVGETIEISNMKLVVSLV